MSSPIKIRKSAALALLAGSMGLAAIANAEQPTIQLFDGPGAGTTPGTQQGTVGADINDVGVITGVVRDNNSMRHGYLRYPDGTFTLFDHPDAGTDGSTGQGTRAGAINVWGAVAGSVRDSTSLDTPYVRDPDGKFHTLNIKDFAGGDGNAINFFGVMVGNYLKQSDPNGPNFLHFHGFIFSPNGAFTIFDPPGSTETDIPSPKAINDLGAITGDYWVCSADLSSCTVHGFLRTPEGKYISFDAPGAGTDGYAGSGTFPQGINNQGEVFGMYGDANPVYHGFVRSADGKITSFDVPTKCTTQNPPADCAYEGTYPTGINVFGRITGSFYGEDGNPHGFWRDDDGTIQKINYDKSGGYFTIPVSINDLGELTGYVYDPNIDVHGILVTP